MTVLDDLLPAEQPPPPPPPVDHDVPRRINKAGSTGDNIFSWSARAVGILVLVITGSIGVFLGYQLFPAISHYGIKFFTRAEVNPSLNQIGISAAFTGSIEVALIALVIAFPIALLTALYISQYAPRWAKSFLVSLIDLMAAVPSIVYGGWGLFFLMPHMIFVARWLDEWFGWIPIFSIPDVDPRAAVLSGTRFEYSAFTAGVVVAMMVIPLACSVMRNVFDQTPPGEREAAYALGSTRWGMIRAVVLPFGRGGIIGGTMLGLGRALGETIAVLMVSQAAFQIKINILENGTVTISSLIAGDFGDASHDLLQALLAAGFLLFLMTLLVNSLAAVIVSRGRSGSGVDI